VSDHQQGSEWWQASDGKWYPPEQHPDRLAAAASAGSPEPTAGGDEPTAVEQPAVGDPTAVGPTVPPGPPPAAPPAGPPAGGPPPAAGGAGKGRLIAAIVLVIALIAGAFVVITQLGDDEAEASVLLEPIGSSGPNPFADSVAPAPSGSLLAYAEQGAGEEPETTRRGRYKAAHGGVVGLYGGTLDEEACDVDQLAGFLAVEEDKAEAWADVLKIDVADIDRYIEGLTPVNLGADTRVINHGFADGEATPRESVLQRGSAVLVDDRGVPRVACYCGNPLLEPSVSDSESFEGTQWSGFEAEEVLVVEDAPQALSAFELRDIETGALFTREAGSRIDRPATQDRAIDGPIDFDVVYDDELADDRNEARYTFDAPDGAILTLTVENDRESVRGVFATLTSAGTRYAGFRTNAGATESAEIILDHAGGAPFELTLTEGPAAFRFSVELEIQSDAGQDGDAGDDVATAFEIDAGDEVEGLLGGDDGTDVYVVDVVPGSELVLDVTNPSSSQRGVFVEVRFEGNRLYGGRTNPGGSDDASILLSGEDSGTLEIIVSEGPGTYAVSVDFVEQADGGQPGDAGDDLASARAVPTGQELSGRLGDRDSADWYTFEAPAARTVVRVDVDAASPRAVFVVVQDETGSRVAGERVQPGASAELEVEATPGATYRIEVTEGRGDYAFTISGG
jgi:hypothetical protein